MTITLFAEALQNRAGIERMTVELANLLIDKYAVNILLIDPFEPDSCPFAIDPRIKVKSMKSSFAKSFSLFKGLNVRNIKLIRNLLKVDTPDVLITVATPLVRISAPAIIGLGIRHIAWEHFNLYAGSKIGSWYKMLVPWLVDATVVLTKADAIDYRTIHAPRIYEIPNFTSIGKHKPSKCEKKILLAIGRHASQKGFDLLIKAWAKTKADGWKLRIVGSGDDKSGNMKLAKDLGLTDRIEFVEATPDIAHEFQSASCFVLSSRFEGLVLVLIEAKMMGLPCISFDCPNSPREVIRDGVDGVLVPAEDVEALSKTLTMTLQDFGKLKEMGKYAREDALKRYGSEAVVKQWTLLIE
ncbi:glycosyltransferase family 4 protein [Parabacteroides goldsteinii]|uniref:Glycosyltransferase n=1 Tax=Parabacteroides goldsteinii TaxID=328812 RepID=A0A6G1ZLS2_9BACT|nr:glycosyltransferase family 4 protein [Parabacteroides goldsteinii]MRX95057.1 glycosyltransferase [Parabacteroides goldsteinii]MRY00149.1 glycosyltransferase [Parabacteroides goldsteinii]MRY05096.1 glycosyltransferase [Parabacteroides goldsteinii]MRY14631.1 glycosyltransferase [Parabacteroides goldsteinii]MRY23908.1 glycosyltransferase [Parabacteroides goldsteinii]